MVAMAMGACLLQNPTVIFKRKFRWHLSLTFNCIGTNTQYTYQSDNAYSSSRPKISRDETEINYLGMKYHIPGTIVTYEPIELSVYDITGVSGPEKLYYWIASYMRLALPSSGLTPTAFGTIVLNMLDGCGNTIETWTLSDVWPSSVDFGDLDMQGSEPCMINLTIRYNLAELQVSNPLNCTQYLSLSSCCAAPLTDITNLGGSVQNYPSINDSTSLGAADVDGAGVTDETYIGASEEDVGVTDETYIGASEEDVGITDETNLGAFESDNGINDKTDIGAFESDIIKYNGSNIFEPPLDNIIPRP
jgi:hypothetical protein